MAITITSFYSFRHIPKESVPTYLETLQRVGEQLNLQGLILLSEEGFNLTVSGTESAIQDFKRLFTETWQYTDILFKDSYWHKHPFKRYKVQLRKEIVTIGDPEMPVPAQNNSHLSPEKFHQALQEEGVVVLDTRNTYETNLGKFKNAQELDLKEFGEFPEKLQQASLPKDKKYLIYCTGGIRCEKAIEEMKKQGYESVYQLEGGILNYLEAYPNELYEGECFVFDHRVALDQNLQPTTQCGLCPHCGQPGTIKIECLRCDYPGWVCAPCAEVEYNKTCSKNCAHHYKLRPKQKGPHQVTSQV